MDEVVSGCWLPQLPLRPASDSYYSVKSGLPGGPAGHLHQRREDAG